MQRHKALIICALIVCASLSSSIVFAQDEPAVTPAEVQALERRIAALESAQNSQGSSAEIEALKAEVAALREKLLEQSATTKELGKALQDDSDDGGEEESSVQVGGFVRAGYDLILENEKTNLDFIGLNDGFVLNDARINVGGSLHELNYFVEVNASTARLETQNNTRGTITTQLTDAYLEYVPFRSSSSDTEDTELVQTEDEEVAPDVADSVLMLRLGHFRRPFDAESIKRANKLYFVERSLETRGVVGAEGRNVQGLGSPRELGFMAHGRYQHASKAGVYYALYATNGNGGRSVFNDNDSLALGGRIEAKYDKMVSLGFAYTLNPRTTGQAPDLIDEDTQGLTVDLQLDLFGVVADAALIRETRSFPDIASEPETTAQGYHIAIAYRAPLGITPSYRFAFLDPTSEVVSDDPTIASFNETDEVTHHTIGLIWDVPNRPVRILTNYTIALENDAQAVANDHLQVLGQMSF